MLIVKIIFWGSLFLIFWTYFGYMFALKAISIFRKKGVKKSEYFPEISLVITAYNEEKQIKQKIENTLALSYPKEKLEIIVVSDGSTDTTEDIVNSFESEGVRLLSLPKRQGKHFAQGEGIMAARSDLLVFSDASTFLRNDAIENIIENFVDSEIGCVSGLDEIQNVDSNIRGEGAYVKYEMKLRSLESDVNSLVGVSGSFFAVRKHLCRNWIENLSSDFYLPIITYMNGYRTVLENDAIGYYDVLDEPRDEFARKVRTVVHGMEVLFCFKEILNPFKYGLFSMQMISHKLSRWLVPLYLIFLFWTNLLIIDMGGIFTIAMLFQIMFYLLALAGYLISGLRSYFVFKIPLFFVMVNYSIIVAWHNFLLGNEFVLWEPTKR